MRIKFVVFETLKHIMYTVATVLSTAELNWD